MKYILIANTGAHRALDKVVTSNFGYEHTYLFREIWSMEDAYKLQGMELFDLVWGQIPRTEVRHYVETRVRIRAEDRVHDSRIYSSTNDTEWGYDDWELLEGES